MKKILIHVTIWSATLAISSLRLFAHGGGDHGSVKGEGHPSYEGFHGKHDHGWEHHHEDHQWHHDHGHSNVYVVDPWYNPGFVYSDTSVTYPYYYNGYPYYYYHPNYYWDNGINVNLNIGS